MFKTFAAALIAASMLTAPVLAQGTSTTPSAPAAQVTKAPAKVVKVKKHRTMKKHAHVRKHVKHVRHARHMRHHVKHVAAKHTHKVHVTRNVNRTAPKAVAN